MTASPSPTFEIDDDAIGFEAIADVTPGGHFFSAAHTMSRYRNAFYEPMLSDWRNEYESRGGSVTVEWDTLAKRAVYRGRAA